MNLSRRDRSKDVYILKPTPNKKKSQIRIADKIEASGHQSIVSGVKLNGLFIAIYYRWKRLVVVGWLG